MRQDRLGADGFESLLASGFRVTDSSGRNEASFGDAYTVLERGDLRLRLVRDRGQEFIDIGSRDAGDEWFDLGLALRAAGIERKLEPSTLFADQTPIVIAHLEALERAFTGRRFAETNRIVEELKAQRVREMFPNLRAEPPPEA